VPLTISRPSKPPDQVASLFQSTGKRMCWEMANVARTALQATTPNKWKGFLYEAVSAVGEIPGGYGVGGPMGGPDSLLPEKQAAPRGTIAEFLKDHGKQHPEWFVGSFPKNLAWWYLPQDAKELLRDERMGGKYGGRPRTAPYWLIAEFGAASSASSVDTGVPAIRYIAESKDIVAQEEMDRKRSVMAPL
jgi:hypothetical protein